jgi:signal transduction histidine kinase
MRDDVICHCKTEEYARALWRAIADRFAACKLALHPEKTKIVDCKDVNRRDDYPNIHSDFLSYQFRARGGIAHDFNNLLTVIIGNLELAELQLADKDPQNLLQSAMAAAEAGATINRRLLSFARRQILMPQNLNLNDRVVETYQLLQPSLGEKIALVIQAEPDLWSTVADPGEVDSAIVNLAINARDAMSNGGSLTITTRNVTIDNTQTSKLDVAPGQYVSISIADTGHGMSPEVLGRFWRRESDSNRR